MYSRLEKYLLLKQIDVFYCSKQIESDTIEKNKSEIYHQYSNHYLVALTYISYFSDIDWVEDLNIESKCIVLDYIIFMMHLRVYK